MFECPWVYAVVYRYSDGRFHLCSTCFDSYEEAFSFAKDKFRSFRELTGYTVVLLRFEEVKR